MCMVDFTGGVRIAGEATCLMLKPLAGGPAKQYYPAELAQSVEWIHRAILSNKSFTDTSDTPALKQGSLAVAGIKLVDTQVACILTRNPLCSVPGETVTGLPWGWRE